MATTKKEISTSVKEKRGTSPSSSKPSQRKPSSSSTASSSTEKQLPNYLKPTQSSRSEAAFKTLKKPAPEDPSQNPNILRRRSFDRPPSAARAHKALVSPVRHKSAATSPSPSFASKSATAPKAPLERVAKKPNAAAKPQTQTLSSSRKTPTPTTSTKSKRGTSTPPPASKKPPTSPDRKEAQSVETKHENKENLDQQVEPEEVVKDDQGDMDDTKIPKAEQSDSTDAVAVDVDTTQVTSVVDKGGQDTADISSAISEQHNEPEPKPEPRTEKVEEDMVEEGKSDDTQHDDEDKENHSQEEIIGDDPQLEKTPHEDQEATIETEHGGEEYATEEVAATEEIEEEKEEKEPESRQEDDDERSQQQGLESSKEEMVQELDAEPEAVAEAANVTAKNQVQGKKESVTPYNDVIEETASKLLTEERKNKVRALVGAFETVIDKENSNA